MKLVLKNSSMEFANYEAPKVTLVEKLYPNGQSTPKKISYSNTYGIRYFQLVQGKTYKITFEANNKSGTKFIRKATTTEVPALDVLISNYSSTPYLEESNNWKFTVTVTAESDGYYVFDDYSLKGTNASVTIEVVTED